MCRASATKAANSKRAAKPTTQPARKPRVQSRPRIFPGMAESPQNPHVGTLRRGDWCATHVVIIDKLIAFTVRLSHLPLAWTVLLGKFDAIFLLLHGYWRISRRCFAQHEAQW